MAAQEQIKISVVIPVYNQEQLIIRALDSIPKRKDIEIIIVNDGSTDKTEEAILNWFDCNSQINHIYFKLEKNSGVSVAINKAYDLAKGEYVVALGSDDYFYTETFIKGIEYLDGTDLVYFNLVTNDGSIMQLTPTTKTGYCGSTKFMRREFLGDSRCPVGKQLGEDYDLYQQLLLKNPTEKFTNLNIKHYNFPRKGSLYWEGTHKEE